MKASKTTEQEVTAEKVLDELKRLRGESLIKDLLLAFVPLLVAGLSIYFSYKSTEKQLEFSTTQLFQTRQIENAKLLESFSEGILRGGKEAELARIALDSIRLTDGQQEQLSVFFEAASGGSDSPPEQPEPASTTTGIDTTFEKMLSQLFAPTREVRSEAYSITKQYLLNNSAGALIDQMLSKVFSDPFNIKGRSNVLSILSSLPSGKLSDRRQQLYRGAR